MPAYTKASERGGVLGVKSIIDVNATSPRLRQNICYQVSMPATTQATTTRSVQIPCPCPNGMVLSQVRFLDGTAPAVAGGTSTISVEKLGADGVTRTALDTPVSRLARTGNVGYAGSPLATAVTVAAGESINLVCVTSNNAVGTPAANGTATLLFTPIEDTVIDF